LLLILADLYLKNKEKHENITTQGPWPFFEHQRYIVIIVDLKSRLIMKDEERFLALSKNFLNALQNQSCFYKKV
jgi:hypothetical protein